MESAVALGMRPQGIAAFRGRDHNGLLKDEAVFGALRSFLGVQCSWAGVWDTAWGLLRVEQHGRHVWGVTSAQSRFFGTAAHNSGKPRDETGVSSPPWP